MDVYKRFIVRSVIQNQLYIIALFIGFMIPELAIFTFGVMALVGMFWGEDMVNVVEKRVLKEKES